MHHGLASKVLISTADLFLATHRRHFRWRPKRDIQFETRVTTAAFDESANRWTVQTDRGDQVSATFCIMATGCLSEARVPDFKGIESFQGRWYHTGQWPHHRVDFTGLAVGVMGTGSSAIQSIPQIAREASHLFVFQRTPNFSIPAQNRPLSPEVIEDWRANGSEYRQRARGLPFGILIETNPNSARPYLPKSANKSTRRDGSTEVWASLVLSETIF